MRNDWGQQAQRALFRGGTPLTIAILAVHVAMFFVTLGFHSAIGAYLAFYTQDALLHPWTVLTWPLAGVDTSPLSLLFSIGWFYLFSGSLERAWGTRDYALFFAAMAGLSAFGLWIGSALIGPAAVAGLWAISGPLAVAWSVINRREQIGIFFVMVPAPLVGALGAVMLWYYAGAGAIGLFALVSCAAAYWYASQGRQGAFGFSGFASSRGTTSRGNRSVLRSDSAARFRDFDREGSHRSGGWSLQRWWKDRQERKRLEAIFRRSGFTDDDKR